MEIIYVYTFCTNFKSKYVQVVFTRCLLGHTGSAHGYLLIPDRWPCQIKITETYFIGLCFFNVNRPRFYSEVFN